MSKALVRWGIIGCGDVCEVKSGPGFQKADGSALVAVMRRDGAKAADFARRHGVPRHYDDAAALIADPAVDAVYIATPPGEHARLCRAVAAARKPVYIEKPMARSADECEDMIAACDAAGVPCFTAFYRRALPRFTAIAELLARRAIGTLTAVDLAHAEPRHAELHGEDLPWRLQPRHSGGGLLLDLGSHGLDLIDFLVGPLHAFTGQARRRASPGPAEDVVVGCGLAGEVPVACRWNFASRIREDRLALVGTEGRITCSLFASDAPVILEDAQGRQELRIPHPPHVQQPLIQSIVDELRGRGRCPSTGRSALRNARALDALLASWYGPRHAGLWD